MASVTGICECGCGLATGARFRVGHNARRERTDGGYLAVFAPHHPGAASNGDVRVHVMVAERAIGHRLPAGAEVHHVDANKQNNANANLVICQDRGYHQLLHARARVVRAGGNPNTEKICSVCHQVKPLDEFYVMRANKSYGRQNACCDCACERARRQIRTARPSRSADSRLPAPVEA